MTIHAAEEVNTTGVGSWLLTMRSAATPSPFDEVAATSRIGSIPLKKARAGGLRDARGALGAVRPEPMKASAVGRRT
jgi:hypothetical protein